MKKSKLVSMVEDLLERYGVSYEKKSEIREAILSYCRDHWEELRILSTKDEIERFLYSVMMETFHQLFHDDFEEDGIRIRTRVMCFRLNFISLRFTIPAHFISSEIEDVICRKIVEFLKKIEEELRERGIEPENIFSSNSDEQDTEIFRNLICKVNLPSKNSSEEA